VKVSNPQELTEEDCDKIYDQVKEETDGTFECTMKQQEEIHSDMKGQIASLRKFLKTTQLEIVQIGHQVQEENIAWIVEVH
jgi:dissimilatory sulfite reductase (desulfoviridin) alpha/beta subunit